MKTRLMIQILHLICSGAHRAERSLMKTPPERGIWKKPARPTRTSDLRPPTSDQ